MAHDETDHLLVCLAEECMEVGQRALKAVRFGLSEIQPGQEATNMRRICDELNDLAGIINQLQERGCLPPRIDDKAAVERKREKLSKFMGYSRTLGTLR